MGDYVIKVAEASQLESLLGVQHEAFGRVAVELGIDPRQLPPLAETLEDLRVQFDRGTAFFVAVDDDNRVIGGVRGTCTEAMDVEVGRLVVCDAWLRRGVASALMVALEAHFDEAVRFVLFTGEDAEAPLALYVKLGYAIDRVEDVGAYRLSWLGKAGPRATHKDHRAGR